MSAAAAPWSVKGIDPKAREIAKDLARRSGMTLGEWLNSMIMDEPEDDDQIATLPRRSPIPDPYDRRNRSRRLDDAYDGPSIEVIAERLEAAEHRSAEAIRSIETAVSDLVTRFEKQDEERTRLSHRLDTVSDELRDGHNRLRKVEQQTRALESDGPMGMVGQRLDEAQIQTTAALKALERSFASLDDRLRRAENNIEPEASREASRFERLAELLTRQVESNRAEMMRRMDVVEIESRADRIERALATISEQSREAEQRSAAAVEAMGREVMRIAQNLNGRVARVEATDPQALTDSLNARLDREFERQAQSVEQRLARSDDHNARAIERLGDEITRISDRLSERIATSERRAVEAIDDISRRMAEHSERLEHRNGLGGELAERVRQSEERTAQLLADARESLAQRAVRPVFAEAPFDVTGEPATASVQGGAESTTRPWSPNETPATDWRAAAFGQVDDLWSDDDLGGLLDAAPFPTPAPERPAVATSEPDVFTSVQTEDPPVFADPLDAELTSWDIDVQVDGTHPSPVASGLFGSSPERSHFGTLTAPLDEGRDEVEAELDAEGAVSEAFDEDQALDSFEPAPGGAGTLEDEGRGTTDDLTDEIEVESPWFTLKPEAQDAPGIEVDVEPEPEYETEQRGATDTVSDYAPEQTYSQSLSQDVFDAPLTRTLSQEDDLDQALKFIQDLENEDVFEAEAVLETDSVFDEDPVQTGDEALAPVDSDALRAAAAAGRASTREALEAARAAMVESEEPARKGFGLKRRGGKSKLQERLDKQARGEGSTIRKTLGASAIAALVVGGGYGFLQLDGMELEMAQATSASKPPLKAAATTEAPIAAMALAVTPTEATPSADVAATEGSTLFNRAVQLLDQGDDRGVETLKRAAELGYAPAQLRLAGLYQNGTSGLDPNPVEARNWARRAAEGGDPRAMHYYAMQLYNGEGGSKNRAAALGWLKRAAQSGRVDSQYNVARLYELGDEGVKVNSLEAFKWYMIAARRGDQQALAAVQRLTPNIDAETRRKAREGADAFTVDPVA